MLTISLLFSSCAENKKATSWDKTLEDKLTIMADSLTTNLKEWKVPNKIFKVETDGAKGDGKTINTKAIQNAIDACSKNGGGYVVFSKGEYVTGTIRLKSRVMIKVQEGSKILGSTNLKDYPD